MGCILGSIRHPVEMSSKGIIFSRCVVLEAMDRKVITWGVDVDSPEKP